MSGKRRQKKDCGNVGDILITCVLLLAMAAAMLLFQDYIKMIQQKQEIDQLARGYLLRMETTGGLSAEEGEKLVSEVESLGVTDVTLEGTTYGVNGYGQRIVLRIQGKIGGEYEFVTQKISTAKN